MEIKDVYWKWLVNIAKGSLAKGSLDKEEISKLWAKINNNKLYNMPQNKHYDELTLLWYQVLKEK